MLSPSSSAKWLTNPPIALLEMIATDEYGVSDTNIHAQEGTIAHALSEHKLKEYLGESSERPESDLIDGEMEVYTSDYLEFIQELIQDFKSQPEVLIEQRIDCSEWVPGCFGTGDCVLVGDRRAHLIDLKYGRYYVPVENNSQLMIYGLGILSLFDHIYDIGELHLTIYQPRINNISTFIIEKDALLEWAEKELKPQAKLALEGKGEFKPGPWLRLTKLRAISKDRAEHHLKLRKYQLKEAHLLSDKEIEEILSHIDDLVDWAKSVREYAEQQAVQHKKYWQGFKLVESRTRRKYRSESKAVLRAKEHNIEAFEEKILPITKVEKMIGKKRFEEIFSDLVVKPTGNPILVPESDGRPSINPIEAKEDFKELTGGK